MPENLSEKLTKNWPDRIESSSILPQSQNLLSLAVEYTARANWDILDLKAFLFQDFITAIVSLLKIEFGTSIEGITLYTRCSENGVFYLQSLVKYNDDANDDQFDVLQRESGNLRIIDDSAEDTSIAGYFAYYVKPMTGWGRFYDTGSKPQAIDVGIWVINNILLLPDYLTRRVKNVMGDRFEDTRMILIKPINDLVEDSFPGQVCQIILSSEWRYTESKINHLTQLFHGIFSIIHALEMLSKGETDCQTISFLKHVFLKRLDDNQKLQEQLDDLKEDVGEVRQELNQSLCHSLRILDQL